jgi:hypothetical protein
MKLLKNFRLMFKKIDPSKFTEISYKRHIIIVLAHICRSRALNIRED